MNQLALLADKVGADIFDQLKAKQIILVSHEEKIEGFVDHVLKIQKNKNSFLSD